jgi:hypothetical protein
VYNDMEGPRQLGTMWRLTRGREELRCVVSTDARGWRLQLVHDCRFDRSAVFRTPAAALRASGKWRQWALVAGWWEGMA